MNKSSSERFIVIWLTTIAFMVFAMVFIGGITRLTDSGLSMVEWKPLVGAIPPLSHSEWVIAFEKYKAFPEFQKINYEMSLSEFKSIFFWEYFHRLFGRLIGVAFFFPFAYLLIKKRLKQKQVIKFGVAFVLGGLQGLLGWYMVKSGLVDRPDVSHFRLAAHLGLAFLIIGYIYYLLLEIKHPDRVRSKQNTFRFLASGFLALISLQIIYGAFVAGLDAGLTHNTFPKMGRVWVPDSIFHLQGLWLNLIENTVMIQFVHRVIAWIILVIAILLWVKSKHSREFLQKRAMQHITLMVFVQFLLGVATIVMYVPISIASLHQIGACCLLLLTVRFFFFTYTASK
jgi:cytochrome c oxidase assembly protein subunit 15